MENGDMKILNGNGQRYWEWLRLVVGTMILPWCIWLSFTLVQIDKRVAVIESNRFSSDDGMMVWRALSNKADKSDIPPAWFLAEFNRLRDDYNDHKQRTLGN